MRGQPQAAADQGARPRAGGVRCMQIWASAALAWLAVVAAAVSAGLLLPAFATPAQQLARDGATWGVFSNAAAMLAAILGQRRGPWEERTHERAILTFAYGNAGAALLTGVDLLSPGLLLPLSLPPMLALALAAGALAAAFAAARPWPPPRRPHG